MPLCWLFLAILEPEDKRGNVKQSYLIKTQKELGTLLHILRNGEIVLKFAVYIIYTICNEWMWSQRPLSRLFLAV